MMDSFLALDNGKFHRADCPLIQHIAPRYMREFDTDLAAFDHGYQPAQCCATYGGPIRQWVFEQA